MSTDKVGQVRSFGDLMFNHRLDILLFLLSTVLPLDIFYRATAEVVGPVFFGDDITTPAPRTADYGY